MSVFRLLSALLVCFASEALAQDSSAPMLVDQFKRDLRTIISEKAPQASDDQRKTFVDSTFMDVNREFPSAFSVTPSQLDLLGSGKSPFSDDQLRHIYADLNALAGGKPMPVLVKYYSNQFGSDQLNPVQKAIYFKLTTAIYEKTRRAVEALKKP
jgi:hypothetical protein